MGPLLDSSVRIPRSSPASPAPRGLTADVRKVTRNAWRRYVTAGDEGSLSQARHCARLALEQGWTLLDWTRFVWREIRESGPPPGAGGRRYEERCEQFFVEALAPFEVGSRRPRETALVLRRLEEWRESQAKRLSQSLHDEAGQLLASAYLALQNLRSHVEPAGEDALAHAQKALLQAEEELRRIAHELRPAALDHLGLLPAIRCLGERVERRAGIPIDVTGPADLRLPANVETTLYRVVQEGLNNAVRHSGASRVELELACSERQVLCRVRDDGRGFDGRAREGGIGLAGMRERLATLAGVLEIESRPGAGTELRALIPLEA